MGCKGFGNKDAVIFVCDRTPKRTEACQSCGWSTTKSCDFPLKGAKEGQTCDRWVCDNCSTEMEVEGETVLLCPVHARIVKKRQESNEEST